MRTGIGHAHGGDAAIGLTAPAQASGRRLNWTRLAALAANSLAWSLIIIAIDRLLAR